MFKTRLLSGILLVIVALVTIISGGNILFFTMLAVSLIGMYELCRVFEVERKAPGILGYGFTILYYVLLYLDQYKHALGGLEEKGISWFAMMTMGLVICLMAAYVFTYPNYRTEQFLAVFFGIFYVSVMLSYVFQTRLIQEGAFLVWLVFICSWGCDTCAYCVGVLIGKHKMAPVLSPKKSIEGAVGGVLGAALLGVLYALAIGKWGGVAASPVMYAVIGAVGGLISMVGDLAASAIKRNHNIKDYGTLIPGHGGILDRFDSVIFTAPIIYYLSVLLIEVI